MSNQSCVSSSDITKLNKWLKWIKYCKASEQTDWFDGNDAFAFCYFYGQYQLQCLIFYFLYECSENDAFAGRKWKARENNVRVFEWKETQRGKQQCSNYFFWAMRWAIVLLIDCQTGIPCWRMKLMEGWETSGYFFNFGQNNFFKCSVTLMHENKIWKLQCLSKLPWSRTSNLNYRNRPFLLNRSYTLLIISFNESVTIENGLMPRCAYFPVWSEICDLRSFWFHAMYACTE